MSVKLSNSGGNYFKQLVAGKTVDEVKESIVEHLEDYDWSSVHEEYRKEAMESSMEFEIEDLNKAVALFDKMKFFPAPVDFAVNAWGYDQTNYENVKLIGQAGASMILVGNYTIYAVAKRKYTDRVEYTSLDSVRTTSWKPVYSDDEMAEQAMQNAYCGH